MQDLVIVGAGRRAGDIIWLVADLNQISSRWRLRGILDDDPAKQGTSVAGVPVIGPIAAAAELDGARFVVGIAHYRHPRIRAQVVSRMNLPRERFATLVHPSALVSPHAQIGAGCIVFQSVLLNHGARLGDHVFLSPFCIVSHDAIVEDFATMALGAAVCGGARLETSAYAGARCVIKDGITVGPGAVAGIGSVVMRDVEADSLVLGNPARVVSGRATRARL